jgi:hypothetical protein
LAPEEWQNEIEQIKIVDETIRKIGNLISHGEGGYESYNTGTIRGVVQHSYLNPPIGTVTSKTINEILISASLNAKNTNRLFATGKYQTIESTLQAAKVAMGLSGNELYDAAMQERVFSEFLFEKAGGGKLADYVLRGKGTIDGAMYAASKEWASIAVPNGMKINGGKMISNGRLSFYEGPGNHANMTSTNTLRQELIKLGK